jgi:hypothetical protein
VDITTERIDAYRERLLSEARLSRRSTQKILVINYGVLKRAVRRGCLPINPAEHAERVNLVRSGDFNVLTPEEVTAVARRGRRARHRAVHGRCLHRTADWSAQGPALARRGLRE